MFAEVMFRLGNVDGATGRMIRRGRSGGSAEMLTAEEQQRIDGHFRAELARLACDFPYSEAFAAPVL